MRETETWIPKPKPEDLQEMLLSSGDSPVDPDFTSDLDLDFNIDDEDDEDYDMSGSGDGGIFNFSAFCFFPHNLEELCFHLTFVVFSNPFYILHRSVEQQHLSHN